MFRLKILSLPANIERLRAFGPEILTRLVAKMNMLMIQLQSKITGETIPAFFRNGAPNIVGSIRTIPATLEGNVIRGTVEGGGPRTTKRTLKSGALVDYAAVQEAGIYHTYEILPFNKKALAFMLNGKLIITKLVTHPGLTQRPFMRHGLQEMEEQIIAGLSEELAAIIGERAA